MGAYGSRELAERKLLEKTLAEQRKETQMSTATKSKSLSSTTLNLITQIEQGLWDADLKVIIKSAFARGEKIGLIVKTKKETMPVKTLPAKVEQLPPPVTPIVTAQGKKHSPYSMKGNKRVEIVGEPTMLKGIVKQTSATYDEKKHFQWNGNTYLKEDVKHKGILLATNATPAYLYGKKVVCIGIAKKMQVIMLEEPNDPQYHQAFVDKSPVYIPIDSISNHLEN